MLFAACYPIALSYYCFVFGRIKYCTLLRQGLSCLVLNGLKKYRPSVPVRSLPFLPELSWPISMPSPFAFLAIHPFASHFSSPLTQQDLTGKGLLVGKTSSRYVSTATGTNEFLYDLFTNTLLNKYTQRIKHLVTNIEFVQGIIRMKTSECLSNFVDSYAPELLMTNMIAQGEDRRPIRSKLG